MTSPFVVACSHCSATLKLKDQSLVGKTVRCPKCSEPFTVEVPASDDDDFLDDGGFYDAFDDPTADDEFEDWDDTYEPAPAKKRSNKPNGGPRGSSRKRKQGNKKGKKKKKQTGPSPALLASIVGGVFLLIVLLGVFVVAPLFQGLGGGTDRFKWLPPDMQTYVEIPVAKAWKAAVSKPLRTSEIGQELKRQLTEQWELDIEEIEKLVLGMPATGGEPITILHASKVIPVSQLDTKLSSSTYAGYQLYEQPDGKNVSFFPDGQTIVTGPKLAIQSAIDRSGACPVAEDFHFVPTGNGIIFGTLSPDSLLQQSPARMPGQSSFDPNEVKSLYGVLKLTNNLDFSIGLDFSDSAAAQTARSEAQEDLAQSKEELQKQKEDLENSSFLPSRQARAMVYKMQEVMESIEFSGSGTTITTSGTVSGGLVEDFAGMFTGSGGGIFPPIGGGIGAPF